MHEGRRQKLADFVAWVADHVTGDEKGQAQVFLDRLFQAFGQKGSLDVGGSPEMRIKKPAEDGGGTAFADYVWKPVVLIEMKRRGVDLAKHYRQAFDYWTRLVPDRPRYVVLCNFDQFHVYDFDRQVDDPVDTVALGDLPDRWGPLAFLFPTNERPTFGNDREQVTRQAANRLAECYNKLKTRGVAPGLRQRFVLQCLVALFAEDIGLLERYTFAKLLDDCKQPSDSYDLIGGLFRAMNRRDGNPGGRYRGVRYFNGGIFADPAEIDLHADEVSQLRQAAKADWSKVSPEIFGTLFEHSMETDARHAFGAHFTSQIDIYKIIRPTITDPWTAAITAAKTGAALVKLLQRLTRLRVLDPACGSGNFLYLAYREMKRLEGLVRDRLRTDFPATQPTLDHVNARQFFGIDVNPFAVELAKVTMMIGRKLAIDELHIADEADLPLDNLDANFRCADALITPLTPSPGTAGEGGGEGTSTAGKLSAAGYIRTPWPPADVVIGNPPFLGAKRLKPERGADYVNAVRRLYPDVPGMADYCVYWIRRAADHLPPCTADDPFAGRGGLVGTQNIRNNQSRVGGLDHVVATGTIVDAVDNQPWSGEANVHVSIANWIKTRDAAVVPKVKRLWSRVAPPPYVNHAPKRGVRTDKAFELQDREARDINPALSDEVDVTAAAVLGSSVLPKRVFQGVTPGHGGFVIDGAERRALVDRDPQSNELIHPYLIGRELVTGDGTPERFVIDFQQRTMLEAQAFKGAVERIRQTVLPDRQSKADAGKDINGNMRPHHRQFLDRWWKLSWDRADLFEARNRLEGRFIACSRLTKRPIFVFVAKSIWPADALQNFMFDDDYSYGVLQSDQHWLWFITKCAKMKSDFTYTPNSVFDTFPWPQSPTKPQVDAVAAAGREVRRVRAEALAVIPGGLRAVYRSLELPGKHPLKDAHAALDAAVLAAYGFSPKADLLKQLLDLNHAVAANEAAGRPVTAPGVPASYGDPTPLVTADCIRPA